MSDDEKRLFARMAEVFAGFLSYTDAQIGRVLDFLEETGQLDNTIIVVISDNGASGEGGPNGSVNETKFFNGYIDTAEEGPGKFIDRSGLAGDLQPLPDRVGDGVQHALQAVQALRLHEGGIADTAIISWPNGIGVARRGARQLHQRLRHHADRLRPARHHAPGERARGSRRSRSMA